MAAFGKNEDKMKKVYFVEEDRLVPRIENILSTRGEDNESVQVQINTKGYENRKDPKITVDIVFPHPMRKNISACVIGNESAKAHAEGAGLPFINALEFEGKPKEVAREKAIKPYKYFILAQDYQKGFNLREILKKRKTHFMCPDITKLPELRDSLLHTYRLKVRDWCAFGFPAGHCDLSANQIAENIKHGVQTIADRLKKGPQNIKDCFVKRTTGQREKLN